MRRCTGHSSATSRRSSASVSSARILDRQRLHPRRRLAKPHPARPVLRRDVRIDERRDREDDADRVLHRMRSRSKRRRLVPGEERDGGGHSLEQSQARCQPLHRAIRGRTHADPPRWRHVVVRCPLTHRYGYGRVMQQQEARRVIVPIAFGVVASVLVGVGGVVACRYRASAPWPRTGRAGRPRSATSISSRT